uniref:Uncharacterized protein n=1 Tax=Yersinia enterocolitica TaxID=630 RepID=B0RKM3_YEREN|nr:hypothetical protein [Yersinia enterocolitica]
MPKSSKFNSRTGGSVISMITTESSHRPLKAKQSQQARQKNDRRQRNPFMKIIKSNLKLLQRREIQPIFYHNKSTYT